jgi:prevent-host-death family protein
MRRKIGLFEAKTRFSEICESVAQSKQAVTVTRRGKPLVLILPAEEQFQSILQRRVAYMKRYGRLEQVDEEDFEPTRSEDIGTFVLDEDP